MRAIKKYSFICAKYVTDQTGENHEKRVVLYYGFRKFFDTIIKLSLLIGISALLVSLKATLILTINFTLLQQFTGAHHMNTDDKCLKASLSILILFGTLVQYTYTYWHSTSVLLLIILTFIFCLLIILKYAPISELKKLTDTEKKRKKKMSVVYMITWLVISVIVHVIGNDFFVLASSFGVFWICMALTPIWYKSFKRIGFARG